MFEFLELHETFHEFALILLIAAVGGVIGSLFKQPLVVSFIAVGIFLGPSGFNLIQSSEQVELLAEIGIALLLFVVGLKLDISLIKTMGKVSLLTGLGQVAFTSVFGYLICYGFGYDVLSSVYIAVALTFSSTIIVVKLLSDKKEIDSLHGKIAIGFLIVQDMVVVILMIVLSGLRTQGTDDSMFMEFVFVILKGVGLIVFVGMLMRFVIPMLVREMSRSQELLVLFSISWAVAMSAGSELLGFSKEVGAFLAGISLAATPYREIINGRLLSLRDFLLLFFFLHLGSTLDLSLLSAQISTSVYLSAFVLIGNPLIVMIIMGVMGYRRRTGFLAGLTVAQISEFSLIFVALGLSLGHINTEIVGLVTLVGLITIALSTYLILYSHQIYGVIGRFLSVFEKKSFNAEDSFNWKNEDPNVDVVLIGIGRYGNNIEIELSEKGMHVMGIDFDPYAVKRWKELGKHAIYGDIDDPELAACLPLDQVRYIISSVPEKEYNIAFTKYLRDLNYKGVIVVTAHHEFLEGELLRAGADLVLQPFKDAAKNVCNRLDSIKLR